jgi:nitrogen regulatory protein PII
MFMICAHIENSRLGPVSRELLAIGLIGMTVSECVGHGRESEMEESRTLGIQLPRLSWKSKIEVAVDDGDVESAVSAILRGAGLNVVNDGTILTRRLDDVVRIRTGETGSAALDDADSLCVAAE